MVQGQWHPRHADLACAHSCSSIQGESTCRKYPNLVLPEQSYSPGRKQPVYLAAQAERLCINQPIDVLGCGAQPWMLHCCAQHAESALMGIVMPLAPSPV